MHRSYLFAPGHSEKLLSRVFGAGADAVILDLEDAVPPHAKEQARAMVTRVLGQRPAWVRINAVRTRLAAADLEDCGRRRGRHPDPQGAVTRRRAMGPRPRPRHAADLRHRDRARPARGSRISPTSTVSATSRSGVSTSAATSVPATATCKRSTPARSWSSPPAPPGSALPSTACTRASTTTTGCASRPSSPVRSASSANPPSTPGSSRPSTRCSRHQPRNWRGHRRC